MGDTFEDLNKRYLAAKNENSDIATTKYVERTENFPHLSNHEKLEFLNDVMKNSEVELFEYLLRVNNEIVSIRDEKESTLLHHAAMNNHPFIVSILCRENGVVVDDYNCYDQSPLMLACTYGHVDVITILLRSNHSIELTDSIDIAQVSEREDILELLISEQEERQAVNIFRKVLRTEDLMKKAKHLQDFDACKNDDKKLAFMNKLMDKNEMEMFKMLLEMRKPIIATRDEDGWTILHNAVSANSSSAVSILLALEEIEIDAMDYTQTTPLMLACRAVRYKGVVQQLLENDCDILLKDNNGWNALDIAKRSKQRDILQILQNFIKEHGIADNGKLAGEYL